MMNFKTIYIDPRVTSVGARLARQGYQSMGSSRGGQELAAVGDSFLGSIQARSTVLAELVVARVALDASRSIEKLGREDSALAKWTHPAWLSRATVASTALAYIATGGLGCSIGPFLAAAGFETLSEGHFSHSQAEKVGLAFTEAVRDYTLDPDLKAEAQIAIDAAKCVPQHSKTAIFGQFLAEAKDEVRSPYHDSSIHHSYSGFAD